MQKLRCPHLLVVGIARHPHAVKRRISKKKFIRRTCVKPFIKCVNQNHVMPTRFVVNDFEEIKELKEESIKGKANRKELKKSWKGILSEKYRSLPDAKTNEKAGNIRFFYSRLRFWFQSYLNIRLWWHIHTHAYLSMLNKLTGIAQVSQMRSLSLSNMLISTICMPILSYNLSV